MGLLVIRNFQRVAWTAGAHIAESGRTFSEEGEEGCPAASFPCKKERREGGEGRMLYCSGDGHDKR